MIFQLPICIGDQQILLSLKCQTILLCAIDALQNLVNLQIEYICDINPVHVKMSSAAQIQK